MFILSKKIKILFKYCTYSNYNIRIVFEIGNKIRTFVLYFWYKCYWNVINTFLDFTLSLVDAKINFTFWRLVVLLIGLVQNLRQINSLNNGQTREHFWNVMFNAKDLSSKQAWHIYFYLRVDLQKARRCPAHYAVFGISL